jgi:hypothetical protein
LSRCIALLLVGTVVAVPACETDKVCGPGTTATGGTCVADEVVCGPGTHLAGEECVPDADTTDAADTSGTDTGPCIPDCSGRVCGFDGCDDVCGDCTGNNQCSAEGRCIQPGCVPNCSGRACGEDQCGGICGGCDDPAEPFCELGLCVKECLPSCLGKVCGPDGCGGSCEGATGGCDGGETCSSHGHCVPTAWTCDQRLYDAGDHCDCGCGAPDPDCDNGGLAVLGCEPQDRCTNGNCEPRVPAAWTCNPAHFDDGRYCECACGVVDPDCDDAANAVLGCGHGETCDVGGTCQPCVGDCTGLSCGDDGCGGSCGTCGFILDPETGEANELLACVSGSCVPGCSPTPILCADESRECGPDGCGGECGTCAAGRICSGTFECVVAQGLSCAGLCGVSAPGGCSCDSSCVDTDTCCPDHVDRCACLRDCAGRVCGDDGCGGSCGVCSEGAVPFCNLSGTCQATCEPQCGPNAENQCGDDGCGEVCGTCGEGEACNGANLCVPGDWTCPEHLYGESAHCDCSCGAPDPDCVRIGATFGCPSGAACVDETGLCDVAFCASDPQCGAPKQCVGRYPAGDGSLKGVCLAPNPAGQPPGVFCATSAGCSTNVCVAERCRRHCLADTDCRLGDTCIGVAQVQPLTGKPLGILGVCDAASAIGASCVSQAECSGSGERCLALVDPIDYGIVLRCGEPLGGADEGAPCDPAMPCALGLVCADGQCARACPAGDVDCPAGLVCEAHPLYPAHASDPDGSPLVQTCGAL